jgi:hypothetical protein
LSNHPRRHAPRHSRPPKIDPVALRLGIELDTRLRGCVCNYDVEHDRRDHANILHDAGCPAEHSGPGLVAFFRGVRP